MVAVMEQDVLMQAFGDAQVLLRQSTLYSALANTKDHSSMMQFMDARQGGLTFDSGPILGMLLHFPADDGGTGN